MNVGRGIASGAAPRARVAAARLLGGLLLCGLLLGSACPAGLAESDTPDVWVEIRGRRVAAELAETPAEQSLGLGERDSLAWDRGMLFVYDTPARYRFWMKGMRFSIDIVWIAGDRIVHVDSHVPFERGGNGPILQPPYPVDAVLEVPAGYATVNRWRVGDRVVTTPGDSAR